MKTLYASIFGLLLSISIYAQPNTLQPKHFLWEISGKDLPGKSYLFGSCPFNRAELFHFSDSLFTALQSCQYFAGEADYSTIDSLMASSVGGLLSGQSNDDMEPKEEENFFTDGLYIDGGPTILDNYLYQVAANLGLTAAGLEELDEPDLQVSFWPVDDKVSAKEKFMPYIETFLGGDSLAMVQYFEGAGEYWLKVLNPKQRNPIQTKSFIKLAKSSPTFSVLSIGHLVGDGGALELLKKAGYRIRRVGEGKKSEKVNDVYEMESKADWFPLEAPELGVRMLSNTNLDLTTDMNFHKGHYSIAANEGLVFFTGFLPKPGVLEADLVQVFKENFFEDAADFKLDSSRVVDGIPVYFASGIADKMPFRAQLVKGKRLLAFQWIFGFAERSLLSSSVDRYFEALTLVDSPNSNWEKQHSALGGFHYLFPSGIPFAENQGMMEEYEERGEISVFYAVHKDTIFGDEYLVRYSDLPPGITYTDTYQSNEIIIRNFAQSYGASLEDFRYHPREGFLGASATLIDSFNNAFFIQTLIRGAELFLQLQKSPSQTRNEEFFDALDLSAPIPDFPKTMVHEAAGFQMKAAAKQYESRGEQDGSITESYDFNVPNTGISLALAFLKVGPYEELDWHDTLLTLENVSEELSFDSLISFQTFKYDNTCPAYRLDYQQDTAMLRGTKMGIFCNNHLINIDVSAPIPKTYLAIVDSLIASIELDIDKNSFASMIRPKDMRILTDLTSTDTIVFRAAVEAFNQYEDFTGDHLPAICELLPEKLLDEGTAYGAKYDIITKLHAFEMTAAEDALVDYYPNCDDPLVRARIVESLSQRWSETALSNLWKLLDQTEVDQALPEGLFTLYYDSLALFQRDYTRIKSLLERGVAISQSLTLLVDYLEVDEARTMIQADSLWLKSKIQKEIATFKASLQKDSTESISTFIMDYLLHTEIDQAEKDLYQELVEAGDIYGKYRVLHNSLLQGQSVSDQLLEEVMENDYYRYWTLQAYHQSQQALPDVYAEEEIIAEAIMKNYIYEKLDYQSEACSLIRILPKDATVHDGNYLFMRCTSEEEQAYYLGCVGPFGPQGQFDFDQEKSAYFNSPQDASDPETLLQVLLDYIDDL